MTQGPGPQAKSSVSDAEVSAEAGGGVVEQLALRLHQLASHPLRVLSDWLVLRLLRAASGRISPFPEAAKIRFARSANKRDPERYLRIARSAAVAIQPGRNVRRLPLRHEEFRAYAPSAPIVPDVRLVAFYLPQFHPFPENDLWWGKGFTEWTNVGKALPLFDGHYQPHCPIHFGYYDLRLPDVMEEQARIARQFGIGGFAYYFYWFGGKTLMEAPLRAMLANPAIDMPFCLSWANENWTRRWDGAEQDVLIGQSHSLEDSRNLLRHLSDYFRDPRYIRVNGCPVLMVYRANIIPDMLETTRMWREEARKLGFKGLYLIATQTSGPVDPRPMGFDAAQEFPPLGFGAPLDMVGISGLDGDFLGRVHDYRMVVDQALARTIPDYPFYRGAMLSWDNTARKGGRADIFAHFSIAEYRRWLTALCEDARSRLTCTEGERLVFINAWNEWAEGAHLEPDQRYGFAYLQATLDALDPHD